MDTHKMAIEAIREIVNRINDDRHRLRAENERLREALRKIRDTSVTVASDMAREALGEKE